METLPVIIKLLPFIGSTAGAAASIVLLSQSNWLSMWASNLNVFKFLANKWYFNMLQNMYVSRYVMLAGYAAIWLMDRYLLEQIGSWKNTLFTQKETVISGAYHRDNYLAQVTGPRISKCSFCCSFLYMNYLTMSSW